MQTFLSVHRKYSLHREDLDHLDNPRKNKGNAKLEDSRSAFLAQIAYDFNRKCKLAQQLLSSRSYAGG